MHIESVLSTWEGESCHLRHDRETGVWFAIAIHSTHRGPAAGGTRLMSYISAAAAVADATRLATAMTLKMAVADLPMGGGKSVIALPAEAPRPDLATRQRLLTLHAHNLERLGGQYWTGPDIGTSSADMDILGRQTRYAFGRATEAGGSGSSAEETAQGVFEAVQATAHEARLGTLADRTLLIQGLGAVGLRVAELAADAGARLLVTDLDPDRCATADRLGAKAINPTEATTTECDILVPCATGGLIDTPTAHRLPCAAIAGAANNILTNPEIADILQERGIVYAPDFVANCGGAIHLIGREVLGWSADNVRARTRNIRDTLDTIFTNARRYGISTERAAHDLAAAKLARAEAPADTGQ
ncbi:phenylalanine dehydrogenase [Prauserella sp. PE36]|uniref:Glu/Leu/Phe/Val dehydrogenase dimerization domain-containing protein n=1 Tax=Prauserella sp. PE36 TaxID=1504709 RepID=UPI000DE4DB19|nr:Glu/Leu/Phe/Val dehydrogenase dimerization domain-containing protein [Prauserella sp. PE36]RBM24266.1 phenylalanine dehydrogenase [Prauserella sp. PE36]